MCIGRCTGQGLWGLVDQDQGSQTQRSTHQMENRCVLGTKVREEGPVVDSSRHALQRAELSTLSSSKLSIGGNCLLSVTQVSDLKKKKKQILEIHFMWDFPLKKLRGPGKALETPVSHELLVHDLWLN